MLLVEKINSYSEFIDAASETLGKKLFQRTLEEGYVSELETLKELRDTFAAINEKKCNKTEESDEDDDKDDDDDDDKDDEDADDEKDDEDDDDK